jgi:hypothetical protein
MTALPQQVAYATGAPSLPPNASSTDIVIRSSNGSTFGENATIVFDLNSAGFIDPQSLYIRYKYAFTNVVGAELKGTPVYTPFQRLSVFVGSTQIENIAQFNQVANMQVNLSYDIAQKYGVQSCFGYKDSTSVPNNEELDGRVLSVNEVGSFSAPLSPCILSNCEKFLPAFAMPAIRVELGTDTLANMFRTDVVAVPTGMVLSNVELCYKQIDLGAEVEAMVRSAGMTHIKTGSLMNSASLLGAGSSGMASIVYNTRLASIKSAFLLFANTIAASNKEYDSVDITKGNGSVNISIAGKTYPQTPLNTAQNKAGVLQALRGAVGSVFDTQNSLSINSVEFSRVDGGATTLAGAGKFIVGIDTSVLGSTNDYIMSGVSSQNSSITCNLQLNSQTTNSVNVHLCLAYDAILELDFDAGQATLKM